MYQQEGNGLLNYHDELVVSVSTSAEAQTTYDLYCDSRAAGARKWPKSQW